MTDVADTPAEVGELLPCPFCGGPAERITIGEEEPNNAGGDVIICTRCQASSHVEFGRKENLVSLWNARTQADETVRLREALENGQRAVQEFLDMVNVMQRVQCLPIPAILETAQHNCPLIVAELAAARAALGDPR